MREPRILLFLLPVILAASPGVEELEVKPTVRVVQQSPRQVDLSQWDWVPVQGFNFGTEDPLGFQPMKSSNNRITRFFPANGDGGIQTRQATFSSSPGDTFNSRPLAMVQAFNNRGGPIFQANSNFDFNPTEGRSSSVFQSERPLPLSGSFNTAKTTSFDHDENDPNPPQVHTSMTSGFSPNVPGFQPQQSQVGFNQQPQDQGQAQGQEESQEESPEESQEQEQPQDQQQDQQQDQGQQFRQFSSPPSGAQTRPATFVDDDTTDGGDDQNSKAEEESSPNVQPSADGPEGKVSESSHTGTPTEDHHLLAGPVMSDQFGSFSRSPTSIAASTFDTKGMDTVHRLSTAVHEAPGDDLTKLTQSSRHQTEDQQTSSSFIDDTPQYHKKFESSGSHSAWHTHRSRHKSTQPTDDQRVFRVGEGRGKTTTFGRTSATTFLGTDTPTTEGKRMGNTNEFSTSFMDFDPTHFRTSRSISMKDAMEQMSKSKQENKSPLPFVPDLDTLRALWTPSVDSQLEQIFQLNPHLTTMMPLIPEKPVNTDACRDILFIIDASGSNQKAFKKNLELVKQLATSAFLPFQKLAALIVYGRRERTRAVVEFDDRLDNLAFMRRVNGLKFLGGIGEAGMAMDLAEQLIANRVRRTPVDIIFVSDGYSGDQYVNKARSILISNDLNRLFVLAPNLAHLANELNQIAYGENIITRKEDLLKLRDQLVC
ncbi:unnamed protein product, partial [Mesorhabditis belari]|uniref:VWFA domain-containing protein n=1 Tax=Mesorhabditis belari TaxID=2138241 RepID=A0AAF3EGY8_9BILA